MMEAEVTSLKEHGRSFLLNAQPPPLSPFLTAFYDVRLEYLKVR
jgi:hypothetical protein